MHYCYILRSKINGKLYIGFTSDLRRRLEEHNKKQSKSTKSGAPFELVYYEAYKSSKDARDRERKLKMFKQGYRRIRERLRHSLNEA
ncbi:GIY-YIG nuclease family protein [Candidatus Falkowbacteria bacterium]|nr:GIY-YIG nuclease family protein [Candidatus Falkowbacteria bacterium]